MTVHLFNPSHDEALAAFSPYYYPCRAARTMEAALSLLPVLWAKPGDVVLTDNLSPDVPAATERVGVRVASASRPAPKLWREVGLISPWGWDPLAVRRLRTLGAPRELLPDEAALSVVRRLSGRETTALLLPRLTERLSRAGLPVAGEAATAESEAEVDSYIERWGEVMVKALWSCSGRGVFPLTEGETPARNRLRRLLREQGGVAVEPRLQPVYDFAFEYEAEADGRVRYLEPSLFTTRPGGGYVANIARPADDLAALLDLRLEPLAGRGAQGLMAGAIGDELSLLLGGRYVEPLGVDLMVVKGADGLRIVPCVEVNLRRTMGHAALALAGRSESETAKKALLSSLSLANVFVF